MDPLRAISPRLRLISASTVLAIPAVVFALNAFISYRERGIVEPGTFPPRSPSP